MVSPVVDNFQRHRVELPSVIVHDHDARRPPPLRPLLRSSLRCGTRRDAHRGSRLVGVIRVDADTLRRLGADLVGLARRLDADAKSLGDVGDPLIAAALADVQHDWSKKRKAITRFLVESGNAATQAADAYCRADTAVCRAATPGGAR
jgi:hypothetical protein